MEDTDSSRFLKVLQGLLDHKVLKEIDALDGLFARATDRILNQVTKRHAFLLRLDNLFRLD